MGTRKRTELIIDIVLLVTGIGLFISSRTIDPGSAIGLGGDFMPKVIAVLWILISIGLLVNEMSTPDYHNKELTASVKGFVATFVLLFAYIMLLDILGFVISSVLYMFIQMCIFLPKELKSKRNYILFLVLAVVSPVLINILFVEVFSLILPTGIL